MNQYRTHIDNNNCHYYLLSPVNKNIWPINRWEPIHMALRINTMPSMSLAKYIPWLLMHNEIYWWDFHLGRGQAQVCGTLLRRQNGRGSVSNHQPRDCLLNGLFRRRSKKTSKLRVTGLCEGNSPGTDEFPTQMASNAENVSIWWRHHDMELQRTSFNLKLP